MVSIRLANVTRTAGVTPGQHSHRAHAVGAGRVGTARRSGGRAVPTMRHGPENPVSRANLPAVKEAGLLSG